MAIYERLSLDDGSLFSSYAENIQRSRFVLPHCEGKRVLDAGCGSGYGAHFLAANGAASVHGFDMSDAAIAEAQRDYRRANLAFSKSDALAFDYADFDTIVNLETLPHLSDPDAFLARTSAALSRTGTLIVSTPNGELVRKHANGAPTYPHQHHTFNAADMRALLGKHFGEVKLYGQWVTHEGQLRRQRGRELHAQLCELYFSPFAKAGRALKRALGKQTLPPPEYFGDADSFIGDHEIAELGAERFPWPPVTLIGVCTLPKR